MKRSTFALLAMVALASCSKENTPSDTTDVAAKFTTASITRVADNEWEVNDQIGITMTQNGKSDLAEGDYLNIPYDVEAAGESGTFKPNDKVIYFPVDGSKVDFYAYCPYATLDTNNDLAVNVATQEFSKIDIVAAKATGYDKDNATVTFTNTEAFAHQLSKLTITLVAGEGITSLAGVTTTIKGQNTTAKYNVLTNAISSASDVAEITAITATDGSTAEAILIPTAAVAGSTIVFALGTDDYIWDTSAVALTQGDEHNYTITITKTGITASGATINIWGDGSDGSGTAE